MKKGKITAIFMAVTLAATAFADCGTRADGKEEITVRSDNTETESEHTETEAEHIEAEETTEADFEVQADDASVFSEVENYEFLFASGVGGWCTTLTIQPNGSFTGQYHDSDMGAYEDGHPNGVLYLCDFSGTFTEPVAVNQYTYQFRIESIQYHREPGEEEIVDGVKYVYSEPYGLDQAEEIYLYLPDAPVAELPQEYLEWVHLNPSDETNAALGYYGLYNVAAEDGFSSYMISQEALSINQELAAVEEKSQEMYERLRSGELTQIEMNQLSLELFQLWDEELNSLWSRLMDKLDADEKEQLKEEEREWIKQKDLEVKAAGSEMEGGSMQPLLENDKAAELTRERVYELAERLKGE